MIVLHPTFHTSFVAFLKHFNETFDYFECHELLEDYWKEVSPRHKNHALTALILLATSMYHWRRGNLTGAIKTMRTSIKRMEITKNSPFFENLNFQKLTKNMTNALELMTNSQKFQGFTIDITNPSLQTQVSRVHLETNEDIHFLIHKHMLRDRSEILEEREREKKKRDDL
ncbi:DUF309 domain-containing protein [Psychrobacillus psychrodurans]|uniref:DUF309 domain-containing protein n=1 Tax=Psychrobacillus psychrodurans TaxID=126157 RepID=UPI0008EEEC46|nr:hypothetical protein SAMN05421832_10372 [Psychrobacillus psychrodurans]